MQTQVTFREAFLYWLKLGFINFGGPAGQIAIMHRDLVEQKKWISEERFLHALNYCMFLPGPEAQQLAIYVGWLLHRAPGGIVAGAFFVIPSIFILLGLSYLYAAYGNVSAVAGVLSGFKPVVVAIVIEAIFRIGKRALKGRIHLLIAALAFIAIYFFHVPFPLIVLGAGLFGYIGMRFKPGIFRVTESGNSNSSHQSATEVAEPAPSPHTVHSSAVRNIKILAVALILWALPYLLLASWRGFDSLHVKEYQFFTKAALVTFGGAYAVLSYVTQIAVGEYGWLTQHQAVDGLALAETTPGPLIMVLQFVGFIAGWTHHGSMSPAASGILGAFVTTYTTFLPSFFFIFLGAPYIEQLRGNKSLSAVMTGITAAVVGVILNLAIVFGIAVIWPAGFGTSPNWFAIALTAMSFFVLIRFKVDVLWVVLTGGLLGFAGRFLGISG